MNKKYYSDMERYEIINLNDGDKYNHLGSTDVLIDEEGHFKKIIFGGSDSKISLFQAKTQAMEIPWDKVKKIGSKTIIIDYDGDMSR